MNCPNCGKELRIDETQQTISCECGKVFKNPMYKPPVEEKKAIAKESKAPQGKLLYVLIAIAMVVMITSLIIGSACLATVKPTTGVAMAKKLQKAGYDVEIYQYEFSSRTSYPADANGKLLARVEAWKETSNGEDIAVDVYFFSTKKAAEKYYDEKYDYLKEKQKNQSIYGSDYSDYDVEIKGKKVFYGNKRAIKDAMN